MEATGDNGARISSASVSPPSPFLDYTISHLDDPLWTYHLLFLVMSILKYFLSLVILAQPCIALLSQPHPDRDKLLIIKRIVTSLFIHLISFFRHNLPFFSFNSQIFKPSQPDSTIPSSSSYPQK